MGGAAWTGKAAGASSAPSPPESLNRGAAEEGLFGQVEGLVPWEEHCLPLGNLAIIAHDSW